MAAVLAGLADENGVRRRSEADGLGTRVVRHEVTGDAVRIVVTTDVPLDWLPSAVTSRLGAPLTVERMEEWTRDGADARSPLTFEFSGLPVACEGTARLAPVGSGSRMDADLTFRVDVPLFGGAVERAVTPRIVAALDAEAAFYNTLGD
ncbi:MAG TPA: DUF2505 domain-containing protein [Lapillicoccus sp.]|nr:DUF2505 domain-containing protein [Lapillicoccus sp.]